MERQRGLPCLVTWWFGSNLSFSQAFEAKMLVGLGRNVYLCVIKRRFAVMTWIHYLPIYWLETFSLPPLSSSKKARGMKLFPINPLTFRKK